MTSLQARIQELTHFRIMRISPNNPDQTKRKLTDKPGIVEKVTLTNHFLKRKIEEYYALKLKIVTLKSEVATISFRV